LDVEIKGRNTDIELTCLSLKVEKVLENQTTLQKLLEEQIKMNKVLVENQNLMIRHQKQIKREIIQSNLIKENEIIQSSLIKEKEAQSSLIKEKETIHSSLMKEKETIQTKVIMETSINPEIKKKRKIEDISIKLNSETKLKKK
jgi:hypothetical protein